MTWQIKGEPLPWLVCGEDGGEHPLEARFAVKEDAEMYARSLRDRGIDSLVCHVDDVDVIDGPWAEFADGLRARAVRMRASAMGSYGDPISAHADRARAYESDRIAAEVDELLNGAGK